MLFISIIWVLFWSSTIQDVVPRPSQHLRHTCIPNLMVTRTSSNLISYNEVLSGNLEHMYRMLVKVMATIVKLKY